MNKEEWTEEILSSLDELKPVQPREGLYQELLSKIQTEEKPTISLYWLSGIAASFLLLVSLNVNLINQSGGEDLSADAEILEQEFDNYSSNQLYEE